VIGVLADSAKEPGEFTGQICGEREVIVACPWAREIPDVLRERNLHGISFAVAHVTATLAELRIGAGSEAPVDWISLLNKFRNAPAGSREFRIATA
jgi:hypothetical protein